MRNKENCLGIKRVHSVKTAVYAFGSCKLAENELCFSFLLGGIMSKGLYWDIDEILPFQRNFNFINGSRSIGKSYTTQKFLIKKAVTKHLQFVYLVRTQDEKSEGVFAEAFTKVLQNEFPDLSIEFTKENMILTRKGVGTTGEDEKEIIGYCFALSEAIKIKKRSFPNVKYMLFDEYMLEEKHSRSYVNGWNEPDLLLSIYDTIDRNNDKVVVFLLGNNTSFYNPYHMHPAFNIPYIQKGEIWKSENILFQWATESTGMRQLKDKTRFNRMTEKSEYGRYANKGDYVGDNNDFIQSRSGFERYMFSFVFESRTFGVWVDREHGLIFISDKYDPTGKMNFALTLDDHKENTLLTKDKHNSLLQWLGKNFKLGNVRYESPEIKKRCENAIRLIL